MREIKFKVWDKPKKKMFIPDGFYFDSHGNITDILFAGGHSGVTYDRFVVVQFTGLHDKNGKEIYEGDIVEADWGYGCPRREVEFDTIYYAKVECSLSDEIKIIGNIYENPELLKGA